jgi:NADPH:quinone reductase
VNIIVEVAAGSDSDLDQSVLTPCGTIAIYANDGGVPFAPDVRTNMSLNARSVPDRWQTHADIWWSYRPLA